jgi:hypothetical protein
LVPAVDELEEEVELDPEAELDVDAELDAEAELDADVDLASAVLELPPQPSSPARIAAHTSQPARIASELWRVGDLRPCIRTSALQSSGGEYTSLSNATGFLAVVSIATAS